MTDILKSADYARAALHNEAMDRTRRAANAWMRENQGFTLWEFLLCTDGFHPDAGADIIIGEIGPSISSESAPPFVRGMLWAGDDVRFLNE